MFVAECATARANEVWANYSHPDLLSRTGQRKLCKFGASPLDPPGDRWYCPAGGSAVLTADAAGSGLSRGGAGSALSGRACGSPRPGRPAGSGSGDGRHGPDLVEERDVVQPVLGPGRLARHAARRRGGQLHHVQRRDRHDHRGPVGSLSTERNASHAAGDGAGRRYVVIGLRTPVDSTREAGLPGLWGNGARGE
jgi:hypothetical protein